MRATFTRSITRPDIYDIEAGSTFPFRYCRVSTPRTEWLQKQGAKLVLESWEHGKKSVFTGLRATVNPGIFTGNLLFPNGKRNIQVEINQPAGIIGITIQPKRARKPRRTANDRFY